MVDLAVPRDVEPEVNDLDDVYLYSVDDLKSVIEENMENRIQAAEQARDIIDVQVSHFLDWQKSLGAVDIIAQIRQNTQDISSEVLNKAKKQLAAGQNAEEVLDFLANTLTNKFLHQPSTKLRQASQEEREDVLNVAKDLFLGHDVNKEPKKAD
jgi:glutamyl-tRNA reductase